MILNRIQAEAVYRAMCELNNIGGTVICYLSTPEQVNSVSVHDNGTSIRVGRFSPKAEETYESQSAFAVAYKLDESTTPAEDDFPY